VNNAGKVPAQKCYRAPQTLTWMRLALDKFKQWRFKLGVTIPKAKIP